MKQSRQVIRQAIRKHWRESGKTYPRKAQRYEPYVNNSKTYESNGEREVARRKSDLGNVFCEDDYDSCLT